MKKENQEKFHQSLLKILYPPPPSPPQEDSDEEQKKKLTLETLYHLPEDQGNEAGAELSSTDDGNDGSAKLTRAQRKRLRKKKLKEAASQRRKIIGPLLPDLSNDGSENVPESVRQDDHVETNTIAGSSGEAASSSKQNKLKQRRKSKKLAAGDLKSSTVEIDASRTSPESLDD